MHPNMTIARSLADVMVDDAATDRDHNNVSGRQPYSLGYQDVPLVNSTNVTSTTNPVPAATATASTTNNHSEEAEWACPRCTLLNPSNMIHCDACLFPRNHNNHYLHSRSQANAFVLPRPGHRLIGDPFVSDMMLNDSEEGEGWVNISRMDRPTTTPATTTTTTTNTPNRNRDNGWIISDTPQQPLSMGYRIFNSALNGAMVGSILAGVSGLIIGGLAGGIGGAWVSHVRHREADRDMHEAEEALFRDTAERGEDGTTNGVRVHRGRNYLIAVRSDENGRRILRLRYNGTGQPSPNDGTSTMNNGPSNNNNAEMEQALSDLLLRMSYMHGLGRHGNIVIQPNLSYEELLERYGMGDENRRGASEEIINSYPVEVIGNDDDKSVVKKDEDDENQSLNTDETNHVPNKSENFDHGTCGICLEDYQKGEHKKSLSCPHSFHKECIDRWLKQVASCPICKKEVEMYQAKKMEGKQCSTNTEG
jgi:hypothetical protein